MKTSTLKRMAALWVALVCVTIVAAQTKTHVIKRGDTKESVARQYGITVKALEEANPNAADYFYAGMTLTIPTPPVVKEEPQQPVAEQPQPAPAVQQPQQPTTTIVQQPTEQPVATPTTTIAQQQPEQAVATPTTTTKSSAGFTAGEHRYYGAAFHMGFEDVDMKYKSSYAVMLNASYMNEQNLGIGATMGLMCNWGIINSNFNASTLTYYAGPHVRYDFSENFFFNLPVCFEMSAHSERDEAKSIQQQKAVYGDIKWAYGCLIQPTIGIHYGLFNLLLGLDIHISKSTSTALMVGIAFGS